VFRRCDALDALIKQGAAAHNTMPAILRTLVVPITVDCGLVLRVAAAEAAWRVGFRHDLALPFLTWALKDEYWGTALRATRVLSAMQGQAHQTVPDLVQLALRRRAHGPFAFEKFGNDTEQIEFPSSDTTNLLAAIATALGECGRGMAHRRDAQNLLVELRASEEADVRAAAEMALARLNAS
jgi:hypothetical protein